MTFTPGESANLPIILKECQKQGLTLPYFREDIAYILATVKLETGWNTLQEIGGRSQAIRLGYGGGANYFGRGYVQLTHIGNYQKFQDLTGKPLVSNPDLVLDPELAAFILVYGMINGSFTGRKLENFAYNYSENEQEVIDGLAKAGDRAINFIPARSIVNGNDKAVLIANYATEYLKRIVRGEFDKYFQIELKPQPSTVISTKPEIWTKEIPKTPATPQFSNPVYQDFVDKGRFDLLDLSINDRDNEVSELKAQNQNLQNQIVQNQKIFKIGFDESTKYQDELNAKIRYLKEEKLANPKPQISNESLETPANFDKNPVLEVNSILENPVNSEIPIIPNSSTKPFWKSKKIIALMSILPAFYGFIELLPLEYQGFAMSLYSLIVVFYQLVQGNIDQTQLKNETLKIIAKFPNLQNIKK